MSPRKSLLIGALAALSAGLVYQACEKAGVESDPAASPPAARGGQVRQPLEFDHEAHIKAEDMDCMDCHRMAEKSTYATLPKLKDCADCHSEPQGKHPDEPKVREFLEAKKEIEWVTVNRLPGHVYFSHRAHVGFAEMKCWDCHADMRKVSKPVTKSDIGHLSMRKCMECHKQKGVGLDCLSCHK